MSRGAVVAAYRDHVSEGWASICAMLDGGIETRAEGCHVHDDRGRSYLDCGGHGVYTIGHSHPRVVDAVCAQIRRRSLPCRAFLDAGLATAAEALTESAPEGLDYAYFTTSGAEATELAIKLGRALGRPRVVSMRGGFHGKTLGALSATGDEAYRRRFVPLLPDTARVPFGAIDALTEELSRAPGRCIVIVEPVQGEGGVVIPPDGYLRAVREACDEHGALMVADEIQTGLGRLGTLWACSAEGVRPDVLLAGKALGGGVAPAAAVLATTEAYAPMSRDPFLHGSTFANSPLTTAAVIETLAVLEDEAIVERAAALGHELLAELEAAVAASCAERVVEVRGRGLMLGIEWRRPEHAGLFMLELFERQVLVNLSLVGRRVSRFTPPAIMERADVDTLLDAVRSSLAAVAGSPA